MITNIQYNTGSLEYNDHDGQTVFIKLPNAYNRVLDFIQYNADIICILEPSSNSTPNEKRRNVIRFQKNGEIVWVIGDKYPFWEQRITSKNKELNEGHLEILNSEKNNGYSQIFKEDINPQRKTKIYVGDTNGTRYELNPNNGDIKWVPPRPDERPW